MRRVLLLPAAALALTAFALSLAGCGLENIPLLSQPGFVSAAAGEIFQFRNGPPGADSEFLGYDLYYKIYHIGDPIDVSISTIDELQLKFRRLTQYATSVLPSPLVSINSADLTTSFIIAVDFSGDLFLNYLTLPQIYSIPNSPSSPTVPISILAFRRGVTYPSSSETKLWRDFSDTDADISPAIWTDLNQPGAEVAIALYVVSYGVDPDFGALYSIPLYLGAIQLNLPPGS